VDKLNEGKVGIHMSITETTLIKPKKPHAREPSFDSHAKF